MNIATQTFTIFVLAIGCCLNSAVAQERIITKSQVDEIFSFTREAWEERTRMYVAPEGWAMRLIPTSGGTGIAGFDRTTGIGLSTQPVFDDEPGSKPTELSVSSYYPLGSLAASSVIGQEETIKKLTKDDLGDTYRVTVRIFVLQKWRVAQININR